MELVQNILFLAKERKITNAQLCQLLNTNPNKVYDWKIGKSKPSAEDVAVLADFFHVSIDYLMGRTDKKEASPSEDELASLLQKPHMKEILAASLQLSPENRRIILAQIEAVKALEGGAEK